MELLTFSCIMFFYSISDEKLCYVCNIRKHRLEQIEKSRPDLTSAVDKDHFMKGDNPLNKLLNKVCILENGKFEYKYFNNIFFVL